MEKDEGEARSKGSRYREGTFTEAKIKEALKKVEEVINEGIAHMKEVWNGSNERLINETNELFRKRG